MSELEQQPQTPVDRFLAMLRAGNYLEIAASAAGISVDELLDDPELAAEIERAAAVGEVRHVTTIASAAGENWQAAAWLLERGRPERWARPAVRQGDEPEQASDALDQLAERRAERRAQAAS